MAEPTPARRAAAVRAAAISFLEPAPFKGRGLSDRTIRMLVDCSIDAPERLLFMTEEQIKSIPGVGKASLAEIRAYRTKFVR